VWVRPQIWSEYGKGNEVVTIHEQLLTDGGILQSLKAAMRDTGFPVGDLCNLKNISYLLVITCKPDSLPPLGNVLFCLWHTGNRMKSYVKIKLSL
jgi:hypothetical protein